MRKVILFLTVMSIATNVHAQCLLCSAIEKKFRLSCEKSFVAQAEVAERLHHEMKSDPKRLRGATPDYCQCAYQQIEQSMQAGEIEMLIELYLMQEQINKNFIAALDGDVVAKREHDNKITELERFSEQVTRMMGKQKREKNAWLTEKFCSPMIDKFLGKQK